MEVSERDLRVMDLMGTRAAAVPAAMTSLKVGSSSYLICGLVISGGLEGDE